MDGKGRLSTSVMNSQGWLHNSVAIPNTTNLCYFTRVHFMGCELFITRAFIYLFLKRFYLFILDRGEGKEKERERNINVWLPLTCLHQGP